MASQFNERSFRKYRFRWDISSSTEFNKFVSGYYFEAPFNDTIIALTDWTLLFYPNGLDIKRKKTIPSMSLETYNNDLHPKFDVKFSFTFLNGKNEILRTVSWSEIANCRENPSSGFYECRFGDVNDYKNTTSLTILCKIECDISTKPSYFMPSIRKQGVMMTWSKSIIENGNDFTVDLPIRPIDLKPCTPTLSIVSTKFGKYNIEWCLQYKNNGNIWIQCANDFLIDYGVYADYIINIIDKNDIVIKSGNGEIGLDAGCKRSCLMLLSKEDLLLATKSYNKCFVIKCEIQPKILFATLETEMTTMPTAQNEINLASTEIVCSADSMSKITLPNSVQSSSNTQKLTTKLDLMELNKSLGECSIGGGGVGSTDKQHPISVDYTKLLFSPDFSDVKFTIDGKEVRAHRAILSARSTVFWQMFESEKHTLTEHVVKINDFDIKTIRNLLQYIYTECAPDIEEIPDQLLLVAEKYNLDGLKVLCENILQSKITLESVVRLLVLAERCKAIILKASLMEFIVENIKELIKFDTLQPIIMLYPEFLYELIKRMHS